MRLNAHQLTELIAIGRSACWASPEHRNKATPTIEGAERFIFDSNFDGLLVTYEDQYLGGTAFQGQELVREEKTAVWGMVYAGFVLDKADEIEQMLKYVLRTEGKRARLGSDFTTSRGELVYQIRTLQTSSRLSFVQVESISHERHELYTATLTAGVIM